MTAANKHPFRLLILVSLFVVLTILGWQLPEAGLTVQAWAATVRHTAAATLSRVTEAMPAVRPLPWRARVAAGAQVAPPANDNCANPTPLTCPATITQDTTGATDDGPPDCTTTNFNSVWFSFTGDGASHTLSTAGSNYDTVLEVFIGPCDDLTSVACNDDVSVSDSTSIVTFTATAGTTYLVRVTDFNIGGGSLTLTHTSPACSCTLTCPTNITQSTDPGQCSAVVNYPAPTTSGNCGPVTCTPPSGSTFPVGTTTVTCTEGAIMDLSPREEGAANGGASCSFTVTVQDTQPPSITCPADITTGAGTSCNAVVNYPPPTVSDNCPGGIVSCSPPSGSTFPQGMTTVTCTATDAAGNTATCSFKVTVNDLIPPTITCPANITVSNAPGQCNAVVNYPAPTASDNCSAVVTCTPPSGSTFQKGTTTVTCTATDPTGNTASCSFTVTVNDTEPPSITCPANIVQSTDPGLCTAVVNWAAPTVSDNCPNVGAPVCTPPSGSTFQKGTTTITCSVSDAAGNTARCSFTVTVNDTEPPKVTCPANIFVGTTGNSKVVSYTVPTATDNCPNVGAVTCAPPSGSAFPLGVTTVTCSVQDASGNAARCNFEVTVNKVAFSINDPLVCAGTVINGLIQITNNGNVPQDVVSVSELPPGQLLALDGTCTATIGTCTIPDASTVRWTGTIPVGQTVTIRYQAQVDDQVLPGTRLCVTTRVSFNGGPILDVQACVTTDCPLPGPGDPPVARDPVSDQKPGSVLIWPIYTSSLNNPVVENTRINITNTDVTRGVFVHFFFVDGSNCSVADSYLCLTPNQTATLLASDLDPGVTGYVVAVAVNGATGCPINFNHLIGDEYVKFASGHAANLGAEAFAAIAGGLPRCDINSTTATLNFDGVSYNQAPRVLAADSIPSLLDNNSTMLIINRVGGNLATTAGNIGPLFGLVYDALENPYSFNFSARCQFRDFLNNTTFPRTTPRLNAIIPAGSTGWMKLNPTDDVGILGAIIVANPNAQRDANSYAQGRNLHKLTFTRSASYTIPVFPAHCQ